MLDHYRPFRAQRPCAKPPLFQPHEALAPCLRTPVCTWAATAVSIPPVGWRMTSGGKASGSGSASAVPRTPSRICRMVRGCY